LSHIKQPSAWVGLSKRHDCAADAGGFEALRAGQG